MKKILQMKFDRFSLQKFSQPLPFFETVLPYVDEVEVEGSTVVLLQNGKLGVGLEIAWPYHLTATDHRLLELEATVARFLLHSDSGYSFQFQLKKESGVFRSFLFITAPALQLPTCLVPKKTHKLSQSEFERKSQRLLELVSSLESTLRSEGVAISRMKEGWRIPLENGAVAHESLMIGGKTYFAVVPQALPAEFPSQVFRPLFFEPWVFCLSAGVRVLSREETEARIQKRKFWLQNALGAGAARQREEVDIFEKAFSRGDRLLALSLVVSTDSESQAKKLQHLLTQATQTPWVVEAAGASQVLLDALPFNHDSQVMDSIGRVVYLPSVTCSKLLPVTTGSMGGDLGKPLQYPSTEGERTGFDLRDTPGCHTAVIAGTRSGKSFLVANMLHRYLSSPHPPVVSILDKRASYEALARHYGGAVIAFTPERLRAPDFPFHPLAGPLDEGHLEFLSGYVGLLAELAKPDEPVHAVDRVIVTEALHYAVESLRVTSELTGTQQLTLTMSDIVSALGRSDSPVARSLSQRLKPYYGTGTYAAYFDRELNVAGEDLEVMSFDLDGLERDKLLQSAISQAVLGQVLCRMRNASQQGRWGILLVEEIGVLGDAIPGLSQFVADAWKTMAKMKVVCIGVTNDVEDYLYKPAAKAIWNNSPNKIYLRMTQDQIRSLITSSEYGPAVVSGQLAELLPCLRTVPGEKADFILSAEERIFPLVFRSNGEGRYA